MFPARTRRVPARVKAAYRSSASSTEAQQLLLPLLVAFLLATALAWPAHAYAQGDASVTASSAGTHTVRAGETLWSLAARYYGDGHKWRELASANGLAEGGERGISVGQVLRVPAQAPSLAQARAAMAEAPPAELPQTAVAPAQPENEPVVQPPAAAPAQIASPAVTPLEVVPELVEPAPVAPLAEPARGTLMGGDPEDRRTATRIGLVRPVDLAAARGGENTTIFLGPAPFDADTMAGTIYLNGSESFVEPAGRRVPEFLAAPFPMGADARKSAGRVLGRGEGGSAVTSRVLQRMQQRDLVQIALPAGADATPGAQFIAVTHGSALGSDVSLAVPTGLLVVEASADSVPVGRVMRLFGVMEQGQTLVPFVEAPETPVAATVEAIETTVRWITEQPLLPSLEAYLILAPVEGATIQAGDRFELLAGSGTESHVAMVRVVRVSDEGATAIVMQQTQPSIVRGLRARRIGRAP